ncbi:MAG: hypothetical protein A2W72_21485 [Burkholderiales bacterium RIFCSPLOWO2_12_67_14]|nr:MAG: hypothetical protein A3I64_02845 [Burkholderiales bacterium RIFCSPLOWO2_02_FULL_67_64]OGB39272.1 MAG: hypothetical protein A2W72_21485 [Burkholderiales bacterium RIFCSPLOWO2_12_67_14]OGB43456.1 MAG: hypothetical protein A3E51_07545 [Burkholderiales bacterium RIFCSPHIGHO2_12_FULL_67_38]OGB75465.1 MAG: hypothetical protein A3G82_15910 [Burkholderiales bacterium RIFCSPLOWO2_12_FULL_67_210]
MNRPAALLEAWRHASPEASRTLVVPDGCRDLIAIEAPGQPARWLVSPLANSGYTVESVAGAIYTGYRLRPGVRIDDDALLRLARAGDPADIQRAYALLGALAHMDTGTSEALDALAAAPNVTSAARTLGLSERSLERLLLSGTGRTPVYWKRLARLRRSAQALSSDAPLAELAVDHGFSDQAHMTREFRRWLGTTPARAQASASWRFLLAQSGYGDPVIGVQSSTRNPSRSDT